MTGTALHTNEIFQFLVLDKIVITFTAKKLIKFVFISTWISVINMRICDVLLNFFVSVYISPMDVMLDFICMGPVDLTGARRKRHNTK